ncbi:MAG: preprotein translocase subunit SecG [Victivallaceae bacterium]|nr:preprotein translocase subunit SecG [Victivallaceae bacterium]
MTAWTVMLYGLVIVLALFLIGLILIQPSKSGGLGGTFGGVGESVFGAEAGSRLTKLTVYMTSAFFLLALLLAVIVGGTWSKQSKSRLEKELATPVAVEAAASVPAPAAEKPAAK